MDHEYTAMTRVPQAENQFCLPDAGMSNCVKDLVVGPAFMMMSSRTNFRVNSVKAA